IGDKFCYATRTWDASAKKYGDTVFELVRPTDTDVDELRFERLRTVAELLPYTIKRGRRKGSTALPEDLNIGAEEIIDAIARLESLPVTTSQVDIAAELGVSARTLGAYLNRI